jgi:hypothetical protein
MVFHAGDEGEAAGAARIVRADFHLAAFAATIARFDPSEVVYVGGMLVPSATIALEQFHLKTARVNNDRRPPPDWNDCDIDMGFHP